MKAAVYTRYGPPEVLHLAEVATPIPQDHEVLVRIHATTVNRTDIGFRKPEYGAIIRPIHGFFRPRRQILGSEFAGVVEAAGTAVTSYQTGDQVFGLSANAFGAHAEYICVHEHGSIAMKPANMSFEEAAAVCDGMMLGWNYVKEIDFSAPKAILVNGADGSIGSACLQLAKHFGAAVTAVCNAKNVALMKELGADAVIDYTRDDFTADDRLYDAVIDAVGKSSFSRCRRLLKPGGVYYSSELGLGAQNVFLSVLTPLLGGKKVGFPLPRDSQKDIFFFKELIETGRYRAVIDRRYTLEQIIEATKYVETGQKTGNVVVAVS